MAEKNNEKLFEVKRYEQYRTVNDLMERSQPTAVYYTLLFLSAFIVAAGLLLGNAAVVIGGMLVTPVLSPVLLIALGVSVGDIKYTKQIAAFVGRSFLVVLFSGLFLGIVFGVDERPNLFFLDDTLRGAVLYFIVAISSGLAATFAWVRKELSEILPGIAVAVSLVPPLSLIGISISMLDFELMRFNFFLFFFNLLGVLVGSALVFSFLKFYKIEKKVEKEAKDKEKEAIKKKKKKEVL